MKKQLPRFWLLPIPIIISWLSFGWLAFYVNTGHVFLIDEWAFAVTFKWRSTFTSLLMQIITFLGSSFFLLPANVLVVLWLFVVKKDKIMAFFWSVTAIVSLLSMYFFKSMFARPRPLDPYLTTATGFSFPSGHTLNGLTFFGLWIFYFWLRIKDKSIRLSFTFLSVLVISGIGISRIFLRVHYATDVLGGISLGTGWILLMITTFYYYQYKMESTPEKKL